MTQISLFAFILLMSAASFGTDNGQTQEFNAAQVKSVKIENQTGDISVAAATGPATVTVNMLKKHDDCEQTVQLNGSELLVKITKKSGYFKDCSASLKIQIPAKVDVAIANGVGNLKITGVEGAVRYDLGVGDVAVDGPVTKLTGNLGTGDLKASGLVGSAELNSGAGDFSVAYKQAPPTGSVSLQVGTGDAVVLLPQNTKFTTSYQSAVGQLKNELSVTKEAKFNVSFQTAAGDLAIKKL